MQLNFVWHFPLESLNQFSLVLIESDENPSLTSHTVFVKTCRKDLIHAFPLLSIQV